MSREYFYKLVERAKAKSRDSAKPQDMHGQLYEKAMKGKQRPLVQAGMSKNPVLVVGSEVIIKVQVFSKVMAGRAKMAEKAVSKGTSMAEIKRYMSIMAAALSEEVSEAFGDNYDSKEFLKYGEECFNQVNAALNMGQLTIGVVSY